MFRLLKDSFAHLFIGALFLRYVRGYTQYRQIRDELTAWMRLNPLPENLRELVPNLIRELNDHPDPPTLPQMIDLMAAQLLKPRGANEDQDIIDVLIKALGSPFSNRRYVGNQIKAIQKAILTPNELGFLTDTLQHKELCCSGCEHPLYNGELITFKYDEEVRIYCYRCLMPEVVRCSHCSANVTQLDRKFYVGSAPMCQDHKGVASDLNNVRHRVYEPATFTLFDQPLDELVGAAPPPRDFPGNPVIDEGDLDDPI